VNRVDGIGAGARDKLLSHGVKCVADLLWTLPVGWDDLRACVGVGEALDRARAAGASFAPSPRQCVRAGVRSATLVPMRGRRAVRVVVAGDGATLDAWWFYEAHGVLSVARAGAPCVLIGRVHLREGKRPTMSHPDLVRDDAAMPAVRTRYPALSVAPGTLRRAVADAVERTATLPDPVPPTIAAREGMPEVQPLLRAVHGVVPPADLHGVRRALAERLAWIEAFTRVWQRVRAEAAWGAAVAPSLTAQGVDADAVAGALGFVLTRAQRRAIGTIGDDLRATVPMRRLLLGDVGTGKTAVALAAAAQCVSAGAQCALLAPTAVLVDQYLEAAAALERTLGLRLLHLVAGMRANERRDAIDAIGSGQAALVVGTHALLAGDVVFGRLGLVIVDEQQRLGVGQRLALVRKGTALRPHLLSLSATPIPRTLALALRGELSTSVLDERPNRRPPVATATVPRGSWGEVVEAMRGACARGERVFVVCPRIDDDDDTDAAAAGVLARAAALGRELAPWRVVVLHGGVPVRDRVRAMAAFRRGEAAVLVGTTVVEVGVDVPQATLMVVEDAECFGLAQLHQLRGRVGRGDRPGRCLLVHDERLDPLARRRLDALVRMADGADVARADLELRGAGDLGGTRQSGAAEDFVWLDPASPPAWLERIEADAETLLRADPDLEAPQHRALSLAVRRFAAQIAVREEGG